MLPPFEEHGIPDVRDDVILGQDRQTVFINLFVPERKALVEAFSVSGLIRLRTPKCLRVDTVDVEGTGRGYGTLHLGTPSKPTIFHLGTPV